MRGMPPGMADLLQRKYAILQQESDANTQRANAATTTANAGAVLDRTRASLMPAESAAQIALQRAQGGNLQAQTETINLDRTFLSRLRMAEIGEIGARTGLLGSQSRLYGAQAEGEEQINRAMSPALEDFAGLDRNRRPFVSARNPRSVFGN